MSFASTAFLIFYPLVLTLYHLLAHRLRLQNAFVLVASFFFYGWWDWRFLGLLLLTSGIDFLAARAIEDYPHRRRAALLTSLGVNLATLFTFKYFDFFATSLSGLKSRRDVPGRNTADPSRLRRSYFAATRGS